MAEKRKNRTKGKGRELKSRITQIRGKAKEENLSKQASKRKADTRRVVEDEPGRAMGRKI